MRESKKQTTVSCPNCGKPVAWTIKQRWKPFCSERCKLIDLGSWLDETNRIPGEHRPDPNGQEFND